MTTKGAQRSQINIPQHVSIVILFEGAEPFQLTEAEAKRVTGQEPDSHSTADSSYVASWNTGLMILSRMQAPNRHRIEIKQNAPESANYGTIKSIIKPLLLDPKLDRPVSLGLNYGVYIWDPSHPKQEWLEGLVDAPKIRTVIGRKSASAIELKFSAAVAGGNLTVGLQSAFLADGGDTKYTGVLVTTNHSTQIETLKQLNEAIEDSRLASIQKSVERIIGRLRQTT